MKKTIVGGVLAGLVLFVWSAIAHMPPMGTAGERIVAASQEPGVLAALRGAMSERAIYVLPGFDPSRTVSAADKQAWTLKYDNGPAAVVAFAPHPHDRAFLGSSFPTWFTVEFLGDMLAGFLGAILAGSLSSTLRFWPRALLMATVGIIATVDIDGSYWNWYGFPTSYFLAQCLDHVVGWLLVGMVLARVFRVKSAV